MSYGAYDIIMICGITIEGKFMVWPKVGFLQAQTCWEVQV
jgi:hypothetical protein